MTARRRIQQTSLASWAGRCPGNNRTGGKRRSGKPTKGNRWLGEVLIECAWAAARSRDTYLSAQYWRLARRIGKQEGGGRGGPLDPGDRLAPARRRLRLGRPWWRLLRPTRHRSPPAAGRRPTPGPRLPRHPRTPRRLTPRGFTFQDEAAGSSPARPTTPALSCANARQRPLSVTTLPAGRLRTPVWERIPSPVCIRMPATLSGPSDPTGGRRRGRRRSAGWLARPPRRPGRPAGRRHPGSRAGWPAAARGVRGWRVG
jgi:hypothetical protein